MTVRGAPVLSVGLGARRHRDGDGHHGHQERGYPDMPELDHARLQAIGPALHLGGMCLESKHSCLQFVHVPQLMAVKWRIRPLITATS